MTALAPARPLPQTRRVTATEADQIIRRHAKGRKKDQETCRLALQHTRLNPAEGLLRQDAGRYSLSTPGPGT